MKRGSDQAAETVQDETVFASTEETVSVREVPRPVPRTVTVAYPSQTFFGTDYSVPVEYMVLPAIWSPTGKMIRPAVVVPRRFGTRSSGFLIRHP